MISEAVAGRDRDDRAAALRQHGRQHRAAGVPDAVEVDREAAPPLLLGHRQGLVEHVDAGIGDQDVDAAEGLDRARRDLLQLRLLAARRTSTNRPPSSAARCARPVVGSSSAITTFAPSAAIARAVASPMPRPPPVTIATLPCSRPAITSPPPCRRPARRCAVCRTSCSNGCLAATRFVDLDAEARASPAPASSRRPSTIGRATTSSYQGTAPDHLLLDHEVRRRDVEMQRRHAGDRAERVVRRHPACRRPRPWPRSSSPRRSPPTGRGRAGRCRARRRAEQLARTRAGRPAARRWRSAPTSSP